MTSSAATIQAEHATGPGSYGGIAVIGAACRMPGADTPEAFWQLLFEGQELIRDFTVEELVEAGVDAETAARPDHVARAAVLDDVFGFDPDLFGYSDQEAAEIDPQQRLFLACACEAMECAGAGGGAQRRGHRGRQAQHLFPRRSREPAPHRLAPRVPGAGRQ